MTNTIYLDCHAGIAGDMLLSSLVDLGANIAYIESHLQKLPLNDFKLHFSNQTKQGIQAKQLDIDFSETTHHRTASDITKMIQDSDLPARVKVRSQKSLIRLLTQKLKFMGCPLKKYIFMK